MTQYGVIPNVKSRKPNRLREVGDTTSTVPIHGPEPVTSYVPDPKPFIRAPLVSLRWATRSELGRGPLIIYNAAMRHGWDVQITYCKGYPPDDDLPIESYALRMSKDDRRAVAVWEDGNVSCVYYWVRGSDGSTQQPRKVTTTDLTGQRETEKRAYRRALLDDVVIDDPGSAGHDGITSPARKSARPARRERPAPVAVASTWADIDQGDTIRGKDGSPWLVACVSEVKGKRFPTIEMTVTRPDGSDELTASVKPAGPVTVLEGAETRAESVLASVFPEVEPVTTTIQTNVWLGELQVEKCRQLGVGCSHERCRWERRKRRGRH